MYQHPAWPVSGLLSTTPHARAARLRRCARPLTLLRAMQTLTCFAVLARMIENAQTQEPQKRLMQRSVTRMVDVLGGCERIMDTPIPLATMRHSARALMIWLAMFPLCMYPALGPHVLWVAPFTALLLFGVPPPAPTRPTPIRCVLTGKGVACATPM